MRAFYEADALRRTVETEKFSEVVTAFLKSADFTELKPTTRNTYLYAIERKNGILERFGQAPKAVFNSPLILGKVLDWRDEFTPRSGDQQVATLRRINSWAKTRRHLKENHLHDIKKRYKVDRSEIVWLESEIVTFCKNAPRYAARALIVATETGLRPGDLRKLSRGHIKTYGREQRIVIRTGKRDRMATIPVTTRMAQIIKETPADQNLILVNSRNRQFPHNLSIGDLISTWRDRIGIRKELRLQDARGTAATRLFRAGCSLNQIAVHMGWSISYASEVIGRYVEINGTDADGILEKLKTHQP